MPTRRRVLQSGVAAGALLAGEAKAGYYGGLVFGVTGTTGFTQLGTHTLTNFSGSTQANAVYKSTESFSPGQIDPTTSKFLVQTSGGAAVTYQYDEVSKWADGSLRNIVFTCFPPSIAASGNHQLKFGKTTGVYSPSTTHVIGDLTSNSHIIVHYKNVRNASSNAVIGTDGGDGGNFTFDVNTAIAANQYTITSNGPCRMAVYVYGRMTDDVGGATYANAFFETSIDVLYNPTTPSSVLSITFRVEVSLPFIDSTATTLVPLSGFFQVLNGASTLRDFSADTYTFTQANVSTGQFLNGGLSAYNNGPGAFHITSNDIQDGELYKFTTGGTPPGNISNNGRYFLLRWGDDVNNPTVPDYVYPNSIPFNYDINHTNNGSPLSSGINITSVGSGTFTLTRYQVLFPYQSIFLCAKTALSGNTLNDQGDRFWISDTGSQLLLRNLDGATNGTTEKARIQATGFVDGWDLVNIPAAFSINDGSSFGAGPHYRPGEAAQLRIAMNAGGSGYNVGPNAEWNARIFCREGRAGRSVTELDCQRRNDMVCAHFPFNKMLRGISALGSSGTQPRIVPVDNGPDNAGGSYATLGAPSPSTVVSLTGGAVGNAGITIMTTSDNTRWEQGSAFYSDQIQRSHWTFPGFYYYLATGDEDFMRMVYNSAQGSVISAASPANTTEGNTRDIQYAGATHWYAKMIFYTEQRIAMALIGVANAVALGDETRPEKAYFKNCIDQNMRYFKYFYNTWKDPSIQTAAWVFGDIYSEPLFNAYLVYTLCKVKNLTRHADAGVALDAHTRGLSQNWDTSTGLSAFWGPTFYFIPSGRLWPGSGSTGIYAQDVQATWPSANGSRLYPSLAQIFVGAIGNITISASPANTADYTSVDGVVNAEGQGWTPTNGDKLTWDFGIGTLPAELSADVEYFVVNLNTAAKTFQIAMTAGGSPISFASGVVMGVAMRPQNAPATGAMYLYGDLISGTAYFPLSLGGMQEASRSGSAAAGLATAIANAKARWGTSLAAIAALTSDPCWRLSNTTAVTVV